MKKKVARVVSLALVVAMLGTTMVGCGKKDNKNNNTTTTTDDANGTTDSTGDSASTDSTADTEKKYDKFLTVDVFATQANYQGIQSGWFAEVVKDKFNM